jgi:hypothetical protein
MTDYWFAHVAISPRLLKARHRLGGCRASFDTGDVYSAFPQGTVDVFRTAFPQVAGLNQPHHSAIAPTLSTRIAAFETFLVLNAPPSGDWFEPAVGLNPKFRVSTAFQV